MSDMSWQKVKDAGANVSLAVPIEMNMRHGMPPILKALSLGIQPSLSVDAECTLNADMFTQMRTTMALQRAQAINVAPLNVVPGAVVSLMERSNVETVIVAGKLLEWQGRLQNVDLNGVQQDLFRPN